MSPQDGKPTKADTGEPKMYQFRVSQQPNLLAEFNPGPLDRVYPIKTKASALIGVRHGNELVGYEYLPQNATWLRRWRERLLDQSSSSAASYPMWVNDVLDIGSDVVMFRHPKGLRIYRPQTSPPALEMLTQDGPFPDAYSWNDPNHTLISGKFYPELDYVGVMARNHQSNVTFYVVMKDNVVRDKNLNPLNPIKYDLPLTASWTSRQTNFSLANVQRSGQEAFVLRNEAGLEIYQFNTKYTLDRLTNVPQMAQPLQGKSSHERVFFADLSHQPYQDILHFNDSGLFVYQFNSNRRDYSLLHFHADFSRQYGWRPEFSDSIQLLDLNADGRDDVVFTGAKGLTALTFDPAALSWRVLLDPTHLDGWRRHATVVGMMAANPPFTSEPIAFLHGSHQQGLHWARVVEANGDDVESGRGSETNSPPELDQDLQSVLQLPVRRDALIPRQIARAPIPEKTTLRWVEQWDDSFLKDALDIVTGQVRFKVPLVDASSDPSGLGFQLMLSYDSQIATAGMLGLGWSLPLAQDFITVNHQGSIYPADSRFYLVTPDGAHPLQPIATSSADEIHFKTPKIAEVVFQYHVTTQRWTVESETETATYGSAGLPEAEDALRWNLSWPNWRGVGRDKTNQERLVVAWYLNARQAKQSQRALYYHYDADEASILQGGKTFTASLRLKSISDGQQMKLDLNYAPKSAVEYTVAEPVDAQGDIIFPVPLEPKYYLQGYNVATATYRQTLKFIYEVENQQRLLTGIEQLVGSANESVLKFDYQRISKRRVLTACTLPRGLVVRFTFETQAPKLSAKRADARYPVHKLPKMAFGANYTVMAYNDRYKAGSIVLRVLNEDATEIVSELATGTGLSAASLKVPVLSFALMPGDDSFLVVLETTEQRELCVFQRRNEIWTREPVRHGFSKEAFMRFSATIIVIAEPGKSGATVVEWLAEESAWRKTLLETPPISRLAIDLSLIAGHHDGKLWICYRDAQNRWQPSQILDLNLVAEDSETLRRFDLAPDLQKHNLAVFQQNGLLIAKNLVVWSTLQLRGTQLSTRIKLFLLDNRYRITQAQDFVIQREKIETIVKRIEMDDSVYQLGNVKVKGKFKLQVTKFISGKIVKSIEESSSNSNRREDEREKLMKMTNEGSGWNEFFTNTWHVSWDSMHQVYASPQGIHCGNDTLLRMTSTGWDRESLTESPRTQPIRLGKYFVLEAADKDATLMKLYAQDSNQRKKGESLVDLTLNKAGSFCNQYPAYFAYQKTPNAVELLTFKDDETLGPAHSFDNEQLLLESNLRGLMTVANSSTSLMTHVQPHEFVVRSLASFMTRPPQVVVTKVTSTAGDIQRSTGYQRLPSNDQSTSVNSETIAVIPAAEKSVSGWHEETYSYNVTNRSVTKTTKVFNASGKPVFVPPSDGQKKDDDPPADTTAGSSAMLYDRGGEWLVSNFFPYSLDDDMVSYYGFESYEKNEGVSPSDSTQSVNAWRFPEANVVKQGFALTGENYLHLNSTQDGKAPEVMERLFQPRDQEVTYLATCWLRCRDPLPLGQPVPYLKAILSTSTGHKIVTLQAVVKQQSGEWFYLELSLDFTLVKEMYNKYLAHEEAVADSEEIRPDPTLPALETVKFRVALRVSADSRQSVDLDHIHFSPITHDFQATSYQPRTGKPTAVIRATGLITRTLYDHAQRDIATLDENGQLEQVISASKTGHLLPSPQGAIVNQPPSRLKFEPESGFHETFDEFAFRTRWTLNDKDSWQIAPGQLWHHGTERHRIEANPDAFDATSAALRCTFSLNGERAALQWVWSGFTLRLARQTGNYSTLSLITAGSLVVTPLPVGGELIVLVEKTRLAVWMDGVMLIDRGMPLQKSADGRVAPWSSLAFEAEGEVVVEDCLFMNRPRLQVEYFNAWGEKRQVVQLESDDSVLVTETLYDLLGREAITTKTTRITRDAGQPLLAFHADFVRQVNPADVNSVWHSGRLHGEVDRLNPADGGVAYSRTEFDHTPLDRKRVLGLPGPEFSITGHYAKRLGQNSELHFLRNHFPASKGYRQQMEKSPNGSQRVSIFDKHNNRVASYVQVPGYDHILSTFEYDAEQNLVKILPPVYHEKVRSEEKLGAWQAGEEHLTDDEKKWQKTLGTYLSYDASGNLIRKTTPDGGTVEYLYTPEGQRRFMVSKGPKNQNEKVVYFYSDAQDQLSRTGFLTQPLATADLRQYLTNNKMPPHAQDYQQFNYADSHPDVTLRGKLMHFVTYNGEDEVVETMRFNAQQQLVSKRTLALPGETGSELVTDFEKLYQTGRLRTLVYPAIVDGQPFRLVHRYNKLGQLSGLGTLNDPTRFAGFSYLATGQLASERHQPGGRHPFTRQYRYNSPGFLEQLADPFLTEDVAYTEGGYGQDGYGDGMVMRTAFNATWSDSADGRAFRLKDDALTGFQFSPLCVGALKRTGHLSHAGQPLKLFHPGAETTLPLVCHGEVGDRLAEMVAEKQPPRYYGHRYAYGNHRELVKAKYFTEETEPLAVPLQRDAFAAEISGVRPEESHEIWQLLISGGYVLTDQRTDYTSAIGKRGKPFFRNTALRDELKALSTKGNDYTVYVGSINKLLTAAIVERRTISMAEFETVFLHWHGLDETSPIVSLGPQKANAKRLHQALTSKGFLPKNTQDLILVLDETFRTALGKYAAVLLDVVRILSQSFANALGETAFDVVSFDIDANGNHRHFYTGFHRYELEYRNATNKIDTVKISRHTSTDDQTFPMLHDTQGNVIQALHKGIQSIEYDPTSQRTTQVRLADGRTLRFFYDAQGERVLKRVLTADDRLSHETRYLRDEKGHVLVDLRTTYHAAPLPTETVVTVYLYGPRGLLGFVRDNTFYSVITDHAGSIRLVVKEDQVVAAYDYLPYGQIMRSYGHDPKAHVAYRYTGQEFDEETGLYNYHARLYDPSIGRFYQPDPQAQYFSPYKYAGNSPVSLVDPDGELAILLTIGIIAACTALGAYLGGAAANNRWDPTVWDYKDSGTWIGIVGGGIGGAFLPVGFAASAGAIGVGWTVSLGVGGAYLSTAASNKNWNPLDWELDRPHTWDALFQGFGTGSGIFGGVSSVHQFAGKFTGKAFGISMLGKKVVLTVSYSAGVGLMYGAGVRANGGEAAFWKWDWENPATWSALVDGFDSGMGWPQSFAEIARGVRKLAKNSKQFYSLAKQIKRSKIESLKRIAKNSKQPLSKIAASIVMVYYMGSAANNDFDITNWDGNEFSTYEGVINGLFFGKDATNMLKAARSSETKKPGRELALAPKKQTYSWLKFVDSVINRILQKTFRHIVTNLFSSPTRQIQLESGQPSQAARDFFSRGVEVWRRRESRLPDQLKRLLRKEVETAVRDSAQKAIESREDARHLYETQKVVFLDEEVVFLNCHRAAKRRKRTPASGCSISTNERSAKEAKSEISERFLDIDDPGVKMAAIWEVDDYRRIVPKSKDHLNGFDPKAPTGFAQHMSLIIGKTPEKAIFGGFVSCFVLGSLLTLKQHDAGRIIATDIHAKNMVPKGKSNITILKTYFKYGDQLVLKTFIHRKIKGSNPQDFITKPANSFYSKNELDAICGRLKVQKIKEFVFFIVNDIKMEDGITEKQSTRMYAKELSTTRDEYPFSKTDYKYDGFVEIKPFTKEMFGFDFLKEIESDNIEKVQTAVESYSRQMLDVFHQNIKPFGFQEKIEAEFQAFLYGSLSLNFKYRHSLDLFEERIAGRGYADVMLLSRRNDRTNKNWNAFPIIFELKADKTSAAHAIDQILGTGYLHNLSMRTVAEHAIVVGINSKLKEIVVGEKPLPQPEGFINTLKSKTIDTEKLINELQQSFNSFSPMAMKGEGTYLSMKSLGEILARKNVEVYAYREKFDKDVLNTFVFKDEDSDRWVMVNILEKDGGTENKRTCGDLMKSLPEGIRSDNLIGVDVTVYPKSKFGWSPKNPKRTGVKPSKPEDVYFFQELNELDKTKIKKQTKSPKSNEKLHLIDVNKIFKGDSNDIKTELRKLEQLDPFINSESDFQAILHGFFTSTPTLDPTHIIKVFPEANLSKSGRSDLLICKLKKTGNKVVEDFVIIIELKYNNEPKANIEAMIARATQQLRNYGNLKSVTDLKKAILIVSLYDKTKGKVETEIPDPEVIHHSSAESDTDIESPLDENNNNDPPTDSIDDKFKKLDVDNPPPPKRPRIDKPGSRRKRSSELLPSVEVGDPTNIQSTHLTGVEIVNNLSETRNQESISDQQSLTILLASTAKSGANRVQFLPLQMIQTMRSKFSSIVSASLALLPTNNPMINTEDPPPTYPRNLRDWRNSITSAEQMELAPNKLVGTLASLGETVWQHLLSAKLSWTGARADHPAEPGAQQPPPTTGSHTGSTLLETGDQWLANTDVNGQLLWLDLLARSYRKYKCKKQCAPKSPRSPTAGSHSSAEFNIDVANVLDEFATALWESATACGIKMAAIERIVEDMWLQPAVTLAIRQQLADGRREGIPARWCELVMKSHRSIALMSSSQQATALLETLRARIPYWQWRLVEQEQAWSKGLNCSRALPTISPTDFNDNVGSLRVDESVQKLTELCSSAQALDNHSPLGLE